MKNGLVIIIWAKKLSDLSISSTYLEHWYNSYRKLGLVLDSIIKIKKYLKILTKLQCQNGIFFLINITMSK